MTQKLPHNRFFNFISITPPDRETQVRYQSTMRQLQVLLFLFCFPCVATFAAASCSTALGLPNDKVVVEVHRNGEGGPPCGSVEIRTADLVEAAAVKHKCMSDLNKYEVESVLTHVLAKKLDQVSSCANEDDPNPSPGFLGYCDRGEEFTPKLNDHEQLVRVPTASSSLPCRFFSREGLRISAMGQFVDMAQEKEQICEDGQTDCGKVAHVKVYAVSAGRVFMFAASFVGEIFEIPHVDVASGKPVYVEVLNTNPRVFEIHNFFSRDESAELVAKALAETTESHRIKRSTTGAGVNTVFAKRTSESGFDTHGAMAMKIKKRCMTTLGFDEYIDGHTDGLQILRYNATKAYVAHMDYMDDKTGKAVHNYDSAGVGGNRYATILLYMTDMEEGEGGETVFSKSWPPNVPEEQRVNVNDKIAELRASGVTALLEKGSWEENMVALCQTKFAVRPHSARAVLFYSQHPDGKEDKMSMHGGCPVLDPEKPKWAANLWVWNTPREGFPGSPVNKGMEKEAEKPQAQQLKATFHNLGTDPAFKQAELFYDESGYWGKIGHGEGPLVAYTYPGHKWNIKVDGKFVKQFVIGNEGAQEFTI